MTARVPDPGSTGNQFYPKPPAPGSNAIGIGAIGEVPIGTIPAFDWRRTVISQYANSPRLVQIIENFFAYVDQTANFDAFFDAIFNLDTAMGYGLDVWGRIVGVNRVLRISSVAWFGFSQAVPGVEGFNNAQGTSGGPFYSGTPSFVNFSLSDLDYRNLILAKAMANISNGSIPSINALLLFLFPHRGNCYVSEGVSSPYFGFAQSITANGFGQAPFYAGEVIPRMEIQYVFKFPLTPIDIAIVEQSGVIPKPTGVAASLLVDP